MADFDLVIQNGTLVTAGDVIRADLAVAGGRVAAMGRGLQGRETVDAQRLLVLPGAVDAHVHLAMPAGVTRTSDDWRSGTVAAACGGTTTVLGFVEPEPGEPLVDAFARRRAQAEAGAVLDFGLHMTLPDALAETLAQIPAVVQAGAISFKTYTTYPDVALDDAALLAAMHAVRAAGGLVMTHCENDAIVQDRTRALLEAGETSPAAYPRSRPPVAEAEAVARALALAAVADVPLYVVHVSTARGAAALARAQARGQRAYGETCPHYLLLTEAEYRRDGFEGARFVCAPPLRAPGEGAALWRALAEGTLHTVATDHCAFNEAGQKSLGRARFTEIPGGVPGIEARLALLHTFGVGQGRLSLCRWVELCCTAPARIFGLYPRKGTLAPGADADIVLFDPERRVTLSPALLHEDVDYTPYAGLALRGYPMATWVRGRRVVREGRFVGQPGQGRYLARDFSSSVGFE